jgi:hypothetical protein
MKMGRPKGSDIRERMEHLKHTRGFSNSAYTDWKLTGHETYGTKESAQREANYYREKGKRVRVITRGRGKYSIYTR